MSSALAHSSKFRMRISAILHALFGFMLVLIAGVLLLPIYRDIEQRTDGQTASDNTRAARAVFAALQALRIERGPTRTTLERPEPASPEFIAITAEYGEGASRMCDYGLRRPKERNLCRSDEWS
jgi:hypothetical protein